MTTNTITYQTLYDKLTSLGFTEKVTAWNEHSKRYFQLGDDPASGVYLPDRPDEEAHGMHVLLVRTILNRYDLIDEDSWLVK